MSARAILIAVDSEAAAREDRDFIDDQDVLLEVLRQAQARGFVGANVPLDDHVRNALGFAMVIDQEPCRALVDLGSGGGVPALVIAVRLPPLRVTLVERGTKRAEFLHESVALLRLADRVDVVVADAEVAARRWDLEGSADAVTARSFGPPAVTAEAACRFLRPDGRLIVSEPPPDSRDGVPTRWPAAGLEATGLVTEGRVRTRGTTFQVLRRRGLIAPHLPRRAATSRKRPLFE